MTTRRPAQHKTIAGNEAGREERKALNMIPVGVTEQDVRLQRLGTVAKQVCAERASASAAVEYQAGARIGYHFYAGSVAAELVSARTGSGNGTACTPKA